MFLKNYLGGSIKYLTQKKLLKKNLKKLLKTL